MRAVVVVLLTMLAVTPWLPVRAGPRRTSLPPPPHSPEPVGEVDPAVVVDLAAAALAGGASVPDALCVLGDVLGGAWGKPVRRAGAVLLLGGSWAEAWRGAPPRTAALKSALEPAWVDGAPPGPLLAQAADRIRSEQARAAREAAARLGVRLVLPLGLCFLPAFVLLGLVPVLVSAVDLLP